MPPVTSQLSHISATFPETTIEQRNGVDYHIGEFWSSKQCQANSLHEISYRACFKPQLPRFFIEHFSQAEDTVYDPFSGRGTTLLESALLKRHSIGNDINPLSAILCSPRFSPPDLDQIHHRLYNLDFTHDSFLDPDLLHFFHPTTLKQLLSLQLHFQHQALDSVDQWIQMVATNRLTGHSPGFFSVYTLPPNQAASIERQIKINAKLKQVPEAKDIRPLILKKSKSLLRDIDSQQITQLAHYSPKIHHLDASNTYSINSNSVDLIITSPPFLNVMDYRADNWMRCWFNQIDPQSLAFTQTRNLSVWSKKIQQVLKELKRLLKPGGMIALEVGEIRKGTINLEDYVIEAARAENLTVNGVLIHTQKFNKTADCWLDPKKGTGTNSNRIVLISHP